MEPCNGDQEKQPSSEEHRGDKRGPTTPDTANNTNSSNRQKQKKPKRGVKVKTAAKERKNLGMFYLKNPSINPSKKNPKVMPEKICANCTCKGKECTMLYATSSIPKSSSSSNVRLSLRSPIISTSTQLVGSMSIIT